YRTPVIVASDGIVGQMMEPVSYHSNFEVINRKGPQVPPDKYQPFEVLDDDLIPGMATAGTEYNFYVTGLTHDNTGSPDMTPEREIELVKRLCDKIRRARPDINDWEEKYLEDAETVILSYGINSRGNPEAVAQARENGHKVGYVRLKTIWPFPDELMERLGKLGVKKVLVTEMNYGQMIREVERFRHLGFSVSGLLVPTTIPFSPAFIYESLMKEVNR
ncbi:MAG: 2-oxoacid:acceptor oxidoreductase subunit alpha, partial [Candidatus Hodarchaeales archaeon]